MNKEKAIYQNSIDIIIWVTKKNIQQNLNNLTNKKNIILETKNKYQFWVCASWGIYNLADTKQFIYYSI